MHRSKILVLTVALLSFTASAVQAEHKSDIAAGSKGRKPKEGEYADGLLLKKDKPPEIPGIQFPGPPAKYLTGFTNQGAGGKGKGVQMSAEFECPEQPQQIISYYHNTLQAQQWKIIDITPKHVAAVIEKTNQSMEVSAVAVPGRGCQVRFGYMGPPPN